VLVKDSVSPGFILLADPDVRERQALANLLVEAGYEAVEAGTGEDALHLATDRRPALAILEVALGNRSGYEVCRVLHAALGRHFPVVFVSGVRTESFDRVAGLLVGASDYIARPYAPDELLARVRRLLEEQTAHMGSDYGLTPREREVLQLLADGYTPAEISQRLFISRRTVGTHVENLFRKLGVRSRAQAIALAYRNGFVAMDP
jgi:DNA-binding NarL/FixJ family response regulator